MWPRLTSFCIALLCAVLWSAAPAYSQTIYTDRFAGSVLATGIKAPVIAATTGPITLSGQQTVDGVALTQGQRVLVKNQADQTTNGIYNVALSTWIRTQDFGGPSGIVQGQLVLVNDGSTQSGVWQLTTVDPVCIDETGGYNCSGPSNIVFVPFTGVTLGSIASNQVLANPTAGTTTPVGTNVSTLLDRVLGSAQGTLAFRGASGWTGLPPGTNGQALETAGASANPLWATLAGTGTVTSVATNNGLTGGPITGTGTIGLAPISTLTVMANVTGGSAVPIANGISTVLDATFGTTQGQIIYRTGGSWAVLTPGSNGQFLQTQGASANPQWATVPQPTCSLSNPGYCALVGGLMVQWGTVNVGNGSYSFATTFPNNCFAISGSYTSTQNSSGWVPGFGCNTSGWNVFTGNLGGSYSMSYIAVGN